nr:hypothetical protein [Lachnospiraceae bacterium]
EHVNCFRKLRTSTLLRFMQEASIAHTEALGMGRDKTLDKGLLWVIARQNIEILKMPEYDDVITIRSYPGEMMHLFFPRFYEIYKDDELLIRGEALWMLIHEDSRIFVFPEEYKIHIPADPAHTQEIDRKPLRLPEDLDDVQEASYTTRFSQLDINGHINNACYFDIIEDLMTEEELHNASSLLISAEYNNEIRAGETIHIKFGHKDGIRYFEGTAEKPKFRIKLESKNTIS